MRQPQMRAQPIHMCIDPHENDNENKKISRHSIRDQRKVFSKRERRKWAAH
jgi:hypothetical protein